MHRDRPLHGEAEREVDRLPTVLTCAIDHAVAQRIRDAMRNVACIQSFGSFVEATDALRSMPMPVAVVVGPQDAGGSAAIPFVTTVAAYQRVAIVVSCNAGLESSQHIRLLARAGAHEFLFRGVDDHGIAVRSVVESAMQACAADRVLVRLLPLLPDRLHSYVRFCVQFPRRALSVSVVAAALGIHRKTLFKYAAADNAPSPGELLAWCRLCLVAEQLELFPFRTVEAIANDLDFASSTALRNMIKRYTGMRAIEIRQNGGMTCVVDALSRSLASSPARIKASA
ncbi:MAG: helix-turn-helix domain-containing protein [bacterium]